MLHDPVRTFKYVVFILAASIFRRLFRILQWSRPAQQTVTIDEEGWDRLYEEGRRMGEDYRRKHDLTGD